MHASTKQRLRQPWTQRWIADQQRASEQFRKQAQTQWQHLLCLLGFSSNSNVLEGKGKPPDRPPADANGLQRALIFLGLPPNTFVFATAVIMAFGVPKHTVFEVLRHSCWPKTRTNNGRQLFAQASQLLGTILAVRYPAGYVSNTLSTAISRLTLHYLRCDRPAKPLMAAICTHEEHMHFLQTALGLDDLSYAAPASCLLLVWSPQHQEVQVYELRNRISRHGTVESIAVVKQLANVTIEQLEQLAVQTMLPLKSIVCASTFGNACPC